MAKYELTDDQVRMLRTLVRDEIERAAELDSELGELDEERDPTQSRMDELRAIEYLLPAPEPIVLEVDPVGWPEWALNGFL